MSKFTLIEQTRLQAMEVAHRHNGEGPPDDDMLLLATAVVSLCDEVKLLRAELEKRSTQS